MKCSLIFKMFVVLLLISCPVESFSWEKDEHQLLADLVFDSTLSYCEIEFTDSLIFIPGKPASIEISMLLYKALVVRSWKKLSVRLASCILKELKKIIGRILGAITICLEFFLTSIYMKSEFLRQHRQLPVGRACQPRLPHRPKRKLPVGRAC